MFKRPNGGSPLKAPVAGMVTTLVVPLFLVPATGNRLLSQVTTAVAQLDGAYSCYYCASLGSSRDVREYEIYEGQPGKMAAEASCVSRVNLIGASMVRPSQSVDVDVVRRCSDLK
ncbi:hypothetical protein MRX96_043743 [Rhipicephalus microplus]